jgi:hypothetical protein
LDRSKLTTASIGQSAFFIPIVTPSALGSEHCKYEFDAFLKRESALCRDNLVFPILYVRVPGLEDRQQRNENELFQIIHAHHYLNWTALRLRDPASTEAAQEIEEFCRNICDALRQPWVSPQERQRQEETKAQLRLEEARQRRVAAAEGERQAQERRDQEAQARDNAERERRAREAEKRRRAEEKEQQKQAEAEAMHAARPAQREPDEGRHPSRRVLLIGAGVFAVGAGLLFWVMSGPGPIQPPSASIAAPPQDVAADPPRNILRPTPRLGKTLSPQDCPSGKIEVDLFGRNYCTRN